MLQEQSGAEDLFVPGEMFYMFQNEFYKCQSVYASYDNIDNVMKSIRKKNITIMKMGALASLYLTGIDYPLINTSKNNEDYDELISDAARIVMENNKASIGYIQRMLRIGYNRAGIIMNQLEKLGVVGPEVGTTPRRVLLSIEEWNNIAEIKQLKKIYKSETSQVKSNVNKAYQSSITNSNASKTGYQSGDETEVQLRDFAQFSIGESTLSISDNKINYTKKIVTPYGKGTLSPSFSGSIVKGLVYKKPSFISKGFITFEFDSQANIIIDNPHLLNANHGNISDIVKIEFNSIQDAMIKLFLQQLSEDLGVPIKRV